MMPGEESYIVEAIASAYGAASEFAFSLENVARELAKVNPRAAAKMRARTSRVMAGLVEELARRQDDGRERDLSVLVAAGEVVESCELASSSTPNISPRT